MKQPRHIQKSGIQTAIFLFGALAVLAISWRAIEERLSPPHPMDPPIPKNVASGAAPVAAPSAATAPRSPANPTAVSRFEALVEESFRHLPKRRDLETLSDEDLHDTPPPMIEAGVWLGRIAQEVADHPELTGQAKNFYSRCARAPHILTVARALCYSHLTAGEPETPEESELPSEVVQLAKMVD